MTTETRQCKNCTQDFIIEPDDFTFYKKMRVPPPTWCPDCRQQRRYAWRNERVLYRRNCDSCGKSTVTIYSPNKPFKVYCPPCFWSDKWNGTDYGRDFDFSRPFFAQWQELQLQVPRIALLTKNSVNSEYTNHADNNKNCYLSFATLNSENILYGTNVFGCKDCVDCYWLEDGNELHYECINTYKSYECQYGIFLQDCIKCLYCYDCRGCSNCYMSSNLRNKQYYFRNEPYTKEEYANKLKELRLGTFIGREGAYSDFMGLLQKKALHKFAQMERCRNVSGSLIYDSKNTFHTFDSSQIEDGKYQVVTLDVKNGMDLYHSGWSELLYETHGIIKSYDVKFTHLSYNNRFLEYCDDCHNSENLFGCVGVKQGRYCIFNKQYLERDYQALKEKIISHMKKGGEYGEFFPVNLSPLGYNETQGQIYMPLVKEEAMDQGYKWEDRVPGTFGKETVGPENIPDHINDISDSIVNEVLRCTSCTKNYNVVRPELSFYRRENIPIPRLCPDCRYKQRIALRLPRRLWHRQCMCNYQAYNNTVKHSHHPEGQCPNEFQTSYSPERLEIVYCEQCYNAEVA